MKGSWKTTLLGALTIAGAVIGGAIHWLHTGTIPALEPLIAAITAGTGLLFARDNDKTSEDVEAK